MKSHHSNRSKFPIVDAAQQSRFVLRVTALPLLVLLVAAATMWFLTNGLFDEAQRNNVELPSLGPLTMIQFLFVVLTGAVMMVQALRYSHRVIGPAHRIAQSLRRIRDGDTNFTLRLREGDELQSILDELNPLLEELQQGNAKTRTVEAAGDQAASAEEEPTEKEKVTSLGD